MAIPQDKLKNWSIQGATVTSKSTHESVRNALATSEDLKGILFEVYLQGSYKNNTNIRGESDVDIVVQLNSEFFKDISGISIDERNLYNLAYNQATYHLNEFKSSVIKTLRGYFGSSAITEGDKCIKIDRSSSRLPADVVVCNQYRKYDQFIDKNNEIYAEGIRFPTKKRHMIISYPKPHFKNGANKNSEYRTNGWYKPNVRVFKNARSYLINNGIIDKDLASSYFIECLLYNAPDKYFGSNYADTFADLVNWFGKSLSNGNYQNFLCQSEQSYLFGDLPEQWDKDKATVFIIELSELWENW